MRRRMDSERSSFYGLLIPILVILLAVPRREADVPVDGDLALYGVVGSGAVLVASAMVSPGPIEDDGHHATPTGIPALEAVLRLLTFAGSVVLLLSRPSRRWRPSWSATAGRPETSAQQIRPLAWVGGDRAR